MEYWGKENQGYSEYTNGTPNLRITPGNSVAEQLEFLKHYYEVYKDATGKVKGLAAKNLRDEIRNKTRFNLDGLFSCDEKFMNGNLRDFLNTSDTGEEYRLEDVSNYSEGWREVMDDNAKKEHQYNVSDKSNRKFVNDFDGREAVFTKEGVFVKDGINQGTFNYAKDVSSWYNGWHSFGQHGRFDMDPFFRQYGITPIYRSIFGHWFYQDEYGSYGKRSFERRYHEHH